MISKKLLALSAGALMLATTSVAAQTVPTAALLQSTGMDETGDNGEVLVGVGFALLAFGALLAFSSGDDGDDDVPVSP